MDIENKKVLWTRNFTIITVGTFISAIGGAAMNLAFSLVVFDHTGSTWLSSVVNASWILPGIIIPIILGPYIDKGNKRKIIYTLDFIGALWFIIFYIVLKTNGFVYSAYIIFSLVDGSIGSFYELTYVAFYPDLISEGHQQKGFAVSSIIFPLSCSIVTPIASIIYSKYGIEILLIIEAGLLTIAACFETQIKVDYLPKLEDGASLKERIGIYFQDFKDAIAYLKKEKGLRNLYFYNAFMNGTSSANYLMTVAFFQSSPTLTTIMFSLLLSAETIGRVVGGLFHYFVIIPEKIRLKLTMWVYTTYAFFDGVMLFLAFPVMLVLKFLCGMFGINTATLRQAATMNYIPEDYRAKVTGFFSVLCSLLAVFFELFIGALGEIVNFRTLIVLIALFTFLLIYLLIFRHRKDIEPIYHGYK